MHAHALLPRLLTLSITTSLHLAKAQSSDSTSISTATIPTNPPVASNSNVASSTETSSAVTAIATATGGPATATRSATSADPASPTPCSFTLRTEEGGLEILPNGTVTVERVVVGNPAYRLFSITDGGALTNRMNNSDIACGFVDLVGDGGEEEEPYFHCWDPLERRRVSNDDFTFQVDGDWRLRYKGSEEFWWCESGDRAGRILPGEVKDEELRKEVDGECEVVALFTSNCNGAGGFEIDYGNEGGNATADDGTETADDSARASATGGSDEESGAARRSAALPGAFLAAVAWALF
jgi:hypothetical protein